MTIEQYRSIIEDTLRGYFTGDLTLPQGKLAESMRYSLLAGGKRIRPILVSEFCRISGGNTDKVLPVACGIEMLHTYSLIHDDLPCMDDDDLRRGRPTNHIVYGDWTATLAGDSLQAAAFETIASADLPAARVVKCLSLLARAVGTRGMCGGQYMDMAWENRMLTVDELNLINAAKTGALLTAACKMGVAAAGGTEEQMNAAENFGNAIGLAFQIRDDMLDVISSREELGKPIGSDAEEGKNTYMALFGLEKCQQEVERLTEEAKNSLKSVFDDTELLFALADSMKSRRN